ncbi:MAG: phosphocholine cytidylyltransferase family protein [Candidatus Bathyarchaeota archaeon]|nr:phosphocholine cytidylyltransferase family protein [Candidatus Bathyarchaeota archaeon]
MKAIIVAAGPGIRLLPFTENKPKCMLEVGGKTILQRMLEALRENGVTDIVMVKGHKSDAINYPNIKYYYNPNYLENNILTSLFYAEKEMREGFIFSYSDILYSASVLRKLLQSKEDMSLVIDVDWAQRYKGRTLHPIDEAELVVVEDDKVVKISKFMNPAIAYGEFIGLAKFTRKGVEMLIRNYKRIRANKWCGFKAHHRFQDAVSIDKAYLTDMLQELINRGYPIHNVDINGGWLEIDTSQDLQIARRIWKE